MLAFGFLFCGYLWISVDVDSLISILSHCNFQLTHVDIVDIKICQATWIRLDPLGLGDVFKTSLKRRKTSYNVVNYSQKTSSAGKAWVSFYRKVSCWKGTGVSTRNANSASEPRRHMKFLLDV